MARRNREPLSSHWERERQRKAAREFSWGDYRWKEERDFWMAFRRLPDVAGAVLKAAAGLAKLQNGYFGAVIRSGAAISQASGIAESTWWNYALAELVKAGYVKVVERGGGLIRKRSPRTGRANVYAVATAAMNGPDGKPAEHQAPRPRPPRSPAPPCGAHERTAMAPTAAPAAPAPAALAHAPP